MPGNPHRHRCLRLRSQRILAQPPPQTLSLILTSRLAGGLGHVGPPSCSPDDAGRQNLRQRPLYTNHCAMLQYGMHQWDLVYRDISWIGSSLDSAARFPKANFAFFTQHALVRDRLAQAQLDLNQPVFSSPHAPSAANLANPLFYWFEFSDEPSTQPTFFLDLTSEKLREWEQWWRREALDRARLREKARRLRKTTRILGFLLRCLLETLSRHRFPCQLIRTQRAWSLLHGSHPPRQDAGRSRPAFAEPGRVCCGWAG